MPRTPLVMHSNSRLRQLMLRAPLRTSRGILSATVLLFLLSAIVQPASLSSSAFAGLIPFACVLGLVALGQTLVIQQGGIDLSVPGVVSLSGVIVSYYSSGAPGLGESTLGLAIFYAVVAALIAGLINGLLVAYARVAPIVATLGMNAVLYGFDVNVSGGTPVQVPESLSQFVDYKILGVCRSLTSRSASLAFSLFSSRRPCSDAPSKPLGPMPAPRARQASWQADIRCAPMWPLRSFIARPEFFSPA